MEEEKGDKVADPVYAIVVSKINVRQDEKRYPFLFANQIPVFRHYSTDLYCEFRPQPTSEINIDVEYVEIRSASWAEFTISLDGVKYPVIDQEMGVILNETEILKADYAYIFHEGSPLEGLRFSVSVPDSVGHKYATAVVRKGADFFEGKKEDEEDYQSLLSETYLGEWDYQESFDFRVRVNVPVDADPAEGPYEGLLCFYRLGHPFSFFRSNRYHISTIPLITGVCEADENDLIVRANIITNSEASQDDDAASVSEGDGQGYGATTLTVKDGSVYHIDQIIQIEDGDDRDYFRVVEINGNILSVESLNEDLNGNAGSLRASYPSGSRVAPAPGHNDIKAKYAEFGVTFQ